MSTFENKGSMGPTVTISREPDRRGNFVCDGTADEVQFQAAVDFCTSLGTGGSISVGPGEYTFAAEVLFDGDVFTFSFDPNGGWKIYGAKDYATVINTAENAYGFRFINGATVDVWDFKFIAPANNAQSVLYGDGTGGVYAGSIFRGGFHNIRAEGGSATAAFYLIHLQNPFRFYWTGHNFFSVSGIGTGANFSCGICIENEDATIHFGDSAWTGYFDFGVSKVDNVAMYFYGSGAHGESVKIMGYVYASNGPTDLGTTLMKVDNFARVTIRDWNFEGLQFGFVLDNATGTRIDAGGNVDPQDNALIFDVNSTCTRTRVNGVDFITVAAGETCEIMDDDVNNIHKRTIYQNLNVESGAGSTVNWNPQANTVIYKTNWYDNGTNLLSEKSRMVDVTGVVNILDVTHGLIGVPEKVLVTSMQLADGGVELTDKDQGAAGTTYRLTFTNQPGAGTWYFDTFAYYRPM